MLRAAIRILALWSVGLSAFAQSTVAGRGVSVDVVNPEDRSIVAWPGIGPAVTSGPAVSTADDTIYSLLKTNGIYPDSEAFALVYDLNPTLSDLNFVLGTHLQIPAVASQSDLARLKASGDLARVTLDPELRSTLGKSTEKLQGLVNSSAGQTGTATQGQLKSIAAWYMQIDRSYHRRTGPPLRSETLHQLTDEAAALNAMLESAAQTKTPLSGDDEGQIAAIYDDLSKVMATYNQALGSNLPKAESACAVIANIKGDPPPRSDMMRVYYTFNGLFRNPPSDPPVRSSSWTQLGSGHSQKLLGDKNYTLWAAQDGDPGHPLTMPARLATDCGSDPIPLDLSVITKVH
jgi:hypothetical protein